MLTKVVFSNKHVLNSASRWQTFDDIYGVVVFINHKISQLFLYILLFFFNINFLLSVLKISFDFNWLKKEIHKRKKTPIKLEYAGEIFFGIVMKLFICRVSEFPIESLNAGG